MNTTNTVPVNSILTWPEYFKSANLIPEEDDDVEQLYEYDEEVNNKVSFWKGDITKLAAECIVIPEKEKDSDKIGGIEVMEADGISPAARLVICASYPSEQDKELLALTGLTKCLEQSFEIMLSHSTKTIGIPVINPELYELTTLDMEDVAHETLLTVRDFISENKEKVGRIVFCFSNDDELKVYEDLMQRYFPIVPVKIHTLKELLEIVENFSPEMKQKLSHLFAPTVNVKKDFRTNNTVSVA